MNWEELKDSIRKHLDKQREMALFCARCGLVQDKPFDPCRACGCTVFRGIDHSPVDWPESIDLEEK